MLSMASWKGFHVTSTTHASLACAHRRGTKLWFCFSCVAPWWRGGPNSQKRPHLPSFFKHSCSGFSVCLRLCVCSSRSVSSLARWTLCWWSTWSTPLCTPSTRPTTTSQCATQRRTARLQQAPALSMWWGCVSWSTVVLIWKKRPKLFFNFLSIFSLPLQTCSVLAGGHRALPGETAVSVFCLYVCVCFRVGGFFLFFFLLEWVCLDEHHWGKVQLHNSHSLFIDSSMSVFPSHSVWLGQFCSSS